MLHFAQFCFQAVSKSSPRGWLSFLGSLFGAIVLQTRPKNHQKPVENQWFLLFALFCSILLPCSFQELSSGLAGLWGLSFWSNCPANLPKKPSKTYWKSMILLFASCCSILLPCVFQELSSELAGLFGFPFWSNCLAIQLLCSGCACFGFRADRLVHKARHSFNKRKP